MPPGSVGRGCGRDVSQRKPYCRLDWRMVVVGTV